MLTNLTYFYTFSNNTIILEETVGEGRNTKDQNSYSARMRIHYKIKPDAGILAFHLDEMKNENGKGLILGHMHKALDGVVGQRSVAESLISPPTVLSEFANQLDWRLAQNNIAIQVDTIEMLEQYVGSTNAGLRLPVQLKIRAGGPVESMSGPSVPVQHMEIVPRTLTPQFKPE